MKLVYAYGYAYALPLTMLAGAVYTPIFFHVVFKLSGVVCSFAAGPGFFATMIALAAAPFVLSYCYFAGG